MIIGLAGVTSTGKTTMANAIKERYGNKVLVQEKISRQEIYEYAHFGIRDNDLRKLSNKERAVFDIARVELQMQSELHMFNWIKNTPSLTNKFGVIDGCTLVKIAYLIYLSAPFIVEYFGNDKLTEIIEKGLEHCNKHYSTIFYLPVTRLPFKEADHRLFKNEYIRTGQDAILNRLMTTKLNDSVNIVRFDSTNMNVTFDELSKMGVD